MRLFAYGLASVVLALHLGAAGFDERRIGLLFTLIVMFSGMPISFVHDLYSPRYKQRPVVHVKKEASYGPPVLEEAKPDARLAMLELLPLQPCSVGGCNSRGS